MRVLEVVKIYFGGWRPENKGMIMDKCCWEGDRKMIGAYYLIIYCSGSAIGTWVKISAR